MEIETAAPAPEEALSESAADDKMYSEAFDRINAEPKEELKEDPDEVGADGPEEKPEEEAEKKAEKADDIDVSDDTEEDEPEEEVEPAPTDLPKSIKESWAKMDAETREAVSKSHRELTQKLSDQGRLMQGINPIKDALTEAAQSMPHLMGMRPEQVAGEMLELAKVSAQFNTNPVETIMGLIEKHGLQQAVAQAVSGQEITQDARQSATLQNELRDLKQKLSRFEDPDFFRTQVSEITQQERAMESLQEFASKAEHWGEVESYMPDVIPLVQKRLGDGASPQDVLSQSYDLALSIYAPDTKATPKPAPEASTPADPKKTEAVLKAKSVNVTGRPSGKTRVLSEDEAYSAAYDRIQNR